MIWPRSAYWRAIKRRKTRQRGVIRCKASFSGRSQRGSKRAFRAVTEAQDPPCGWKMSQRHPAPMS